MRVAIYARHSTDRQTTSTQDQIVRCEGHCSAQKYHVIDVYYDEAMSGAHMDSRPGISSLLMGAFDNRFDRIVCEDLSRISRDQGDVANFFKKMGFVGIEVETISEGIINELHIGLKGTMNALYLKDLSDKTHRGVVSAVLRGGVPGGNTYGYELVRTFDERGEPIRGKRQIIESEAATVRKIFELYQSGNKLKYICEELDAESIASPNGGKWNSTTLVGTRSRKTGLLRNTLYKGIVTFNKLHYRKNPSTGRKVPVVRPEDEWVRVPIPELQIVDDQVFDEVQSMLDERSSKANEYREMVKLRSPEETKQLHKNLNRSWRERQIKTRERVTAVFAGRLRCAEHGTKIGAHWAHHYSCSNPNCPHRSVPYDQLIDVVVREAQRLKTSDIAQFYDSDEMVEKRERVNKRIQTAEVRLKGLRDRAEHILNSLDLLNGNAWLEDNAEEVRLIRLEIDREKRKLKEISRPTNIKEIHERFLRLIDKLLVWTRDPEAVTQLRHTMKLYYIHAKWDALSDHCYRTCVIEYDFPAMVRVLGQKK
ncbi:recombinase family protein [Thalassospira lucentensis]|uniref:recombinase family protein n=1 Tax=Thalassospira lucentensis TaxID=168935 RepID=UPI003AA81E5D